MKDVIIIGAGPGGFDAALYAAKQGLSVTLIEGHIVGGTCLNYGCIPTKALFQNAKSIHHFKNLKTFGIETKDYTLNFDQVKTRKEAIVDGQIKGINMSLKRSGVELVEGYAQFVDAHTVKVNDATYAGKNIIIATGSKPRMLKFNGADLPCIHSSKSLLDLKTLPKKMLVVGAGVIGTELAQIFHAFNTEITLIDFQDDILMTEDKEIRKRARNLFKRQGIDIHTNAALKEVIKENDTYIARFETPKKTESVEVDAVLLAVGRQANLGGLDLKSLDINHSDHGIDVNANKQTNIDHIYAIGDVNNEMMLAHKATYDGYRAINHILKKADNIRFDVVPSVIFSHPLIASVGVKEDDLEANTYKTAKALFKANAKAQAMDDTDGFVKLITDTNDVLIGAHIIGNSADHLIHELTTLIHTKQSIKKAHDIIHAHPTVSEVIHDALKQLH